MATEPTPPGRTRSPQPRVVGALCIVYVVWGSTYLAIRVLVEEVPPLLAAGLRFALAAMLLAALVAATVSVGALRTSRREAASASLVGVLILAGGIGLVTVAERTAPSGLAALVIGTVPLWVLLLRLLFGERPRSRTIIGVAVGLAGVTLVIGGGADVDVRAGDLAALVVAAVLTALGTALSPRLPMPPNPFTAATVEMAAAGVVLTLGAVVAGELPELALGELSVDAIAAFVYLVTMGSIVAYSAFVWLLDNANVSLVATYAYVNPVVAVALGWAILDERITLPIAAGAVAVLASVAATSSEAAEAR